MKDAKPEQSETVNVQMTNTNAMMLIAETKGDRSRQTEANTGRHKETQWRIGRYNETEGDGGRQMETMETGVDEQAAYPNIIS